MSISGDFLCPLCGRDNGCAVSRGEDPARCWCMTARIPAALLERIPAEHRGKTCVCLSCVEAYRSINPNPEQPGD